MRRLPIITTSEMKTFQRCRRLHHYVYDLGYKPIERAKPLDLGSVSHAGLETWWATAGDIEAAMGAVSDAHSRTELDVYDLTRAEVMMAGYHARWIDEPITVIAVEQEFRVPIVLPSGGSHHVDLAGKFDALCAIDDRVHVPEHKTKSEKVESSAYFEQLRADVQVSNYLIAAHALGHEPGGALYDVLVKPPEPKRATPTENRRYTKAGALYANQRAEDEPVEEYRERISALVMADPNAYYQRAIVTRFDGEIENAMLDLWHVAEAITSKRTFHPRTPGACRDYARPCDFWEICWGGASLEDSDRFRRLDNPHEELSADPEKTLVPASPHPAGPSTREDTKEVSL